MDRVVFVLGLSGVDTFIESIDNDSMALSMFQAFSRSYGDDYWREPHKCPYFRRVQVVGADHTSMKQHNGPRFAAQRMHHV